jgi:hypothetical protein
MTASSRGFQERKGSRKLRFGVMIAEEMQGQLLAADEGAALLLDSSANALYLRYAFVERGSEQHIFPESVLDDWGHEIKSLSLYDWVFENGLHFPRAEMFGFVAEGSRRQRFLRELDLTGGLVCYVYQRPSSSLAEGSIIEAVLVADARFDQPRRIVRPEIVAPPLAYARVAWWSLNTDQATKIELAKLFMA